MDVREIWWEVLDWFHLSQGSVTGLCEHNNEPSVSTFQERLCSMSLV